jgi:hypothetical protein
MSKTPEQMLDALGKAFPREALKQRSGGGGKPFTYIETHTCINRLNAATNGEWSFRLVDVQWRADLLIVQGELTIPGLGTRSGFGVQKVAERAGEDLVKGASSDALKKCATLFGVGLELYGPDYEAGEIAPPQQRPQATQRPPQQPTPATQVQPRTGHQTAPQGQQSAKDDIRENAMRRLHAVGKEHGISHDELRALAQQKGAVGGIGVESLADAPTLMLKEMADAIQRDPARIRAWLDRQAAAQAELMPGVGTVPNPDRFRD